jgi:hypothetical protein
MTFQIAFQRTIKTNYKTTYGFQITFQIRNDKLNNLFKSKLGQ